MKVIVLSKTKAAILPEDTPVDDDIFEIDAPTHRQTYLGVAFGIDCRPIFENGLVVDIGESEEFPENVGWYKEHVVAKQVTDGRIDPEGYNYRRLKLVNYTLPQEEIPVEQTPDH